MRCFKKTMCYGQTVQTALPPDAPFGVAPILNEGIAGNHYWFLSQFIEGMPFSIEEKGLTTIQPVKPEDYFGNIAALLHFIEKAPIESLHGIDQRLSIPLRNQTSVSSSLK